MEIIGGTSSTLSKWQVALIVGAPVVLGIGYVYFRNKDTSKKKPGKSKEKKLATLNKQEKQKSLIESSRTPLGQANAFKSKGNQFFNIGKYDEAICNYNMAIDTCPKENSEELATFYQNRAAAYEKLQKFSAVKADCTQALELNPKYIKALTRRARVLELSNDLETALEDMTLAYFLENFSNESTLCEADKILRKLSLKNTQEYVQNRKPLMPSKYFINNYLSGFNNDPILNEMKTSSLDESTPYNRALLALKNQEYDNIIPLCTEALNNLSSDDDSLNKLKITLLRTTFYILCQNNEALAELNTIIDSDKCTPELKVNALIKRANLYIQLDDLKRSFEDLTEAEKIDPQCGDIYHNRGQIHFVLENFKEASKDFKRSVELNPDFGITFAQKCYMDYHYSKLISDTNLAKDVISDFKESFEKFPDCIHCYILYGQALMTDNEYEKADMYFTEALKMDPNNATVYIYRGLICLRWKNDTEKAIEFIHKALEFDDKCEYAYDVLGTMEVQRGNLKYAISLFDKAIPLARTLHEITQTFNLRDITKSQLMVSERLGTGFEHIIKF
ncbi:PREDICTED: mitochondrial import receptor subunit TOM70 [Ceratosolen solmsi marchali]|uniref:Mitochondrial import receptor subunit TOM70 n=1 Tax=Ceratosolen solmsi marchali TaxID=326594 RepID=A0AAJ6YLT0_9HYME|nr:PREDICTED: mitochondrial import receptor subunit TOM70 [Ceratosolen solmsi marchali]